MEKAGWFIIGFGDIGRRVARLLQERGEEVGALVRGRHGFEPAPGVSTISGDLDDPETLRDLPLKNAVVFYFAPPPGGGHLDTRVRNFCAAVPSGEEPRRVVYISTSGVYGDCGRDLVTEETPANPKTPRAKRRLDAETALLEWGKERQVAIVVLRVTGIYGPGRLPFQHLAAGEPVLREEEASVTNRIHADDLAVVALAAAERGGAGAIYNVSDGHPGTLTEYFVKSARVLGLPEPRRVSREEARREMNPLMLSYIDEERVLDNGKMLRELGVRLRYPTLDEGMEASRPEHSTD